MVRGIIKSILLVTLLFSSTAYADVYQAMEKIEAYFANMHGIIVDENGIIDLGTGQSLTPGTKLSVFEEGAEIIHPVTGKVLGKKRRVSGEIVVTEVQEGFSEVKIIGNLKPSQKDSVGFLLPVGVKYEFVKSNPEGEKIIDSILSSNSVMKSGEDYTLQFDSLAGRTSYKVIQKDGTTIFSGTVHKEGVKVLEPVSNHSLPNERFLSMSMGRIYKGDSSKYLVASTSYKIYIFDPSQNYKKVEEIKHSFSQIANIEVADLDGDGQDEIFVSNIREGKWAFSLIFKHDGKAFMPVKKDIPYVFRSVLSHGARKMMMQEISKTGGYKGEIFEYLYKNGDYIQGEVLKGTLGKGLFGFAYMDESDDDKRFFNINSNGNLEVSTFRKKEYVSSVYFGDTINVIEVAGDKGYVEDDERPNKSNESIIVYPRIEIIDDKYIVVVRNDLKSRLFMSSMVFDGSYVTVNSFNVGLLKEELISSEIPPFISDIFIYEDKGNTYIAALKTTNEWLFQSAESELIIFKAVISN